MNGSNPLLRPPAIKEPSPMYEHATTPNRRTTLTDISDRIEAMLIWADTLVNMLNGISGHLSGAQPSEMDKPVPDNLSGRIEIIDCALEMLEMKQARARALAEQIAAALGISTGSPQAPTAEKVAMAQRVVGGTLAGFSADRQYGR